MSICKIKGFYHAELLFPFKTIRSVQYSLLPQSNTSLTYNEYTDYQYDFVYLLTISHLVIFYNIVNNGYCRKKGKRKGTTP